MSSGRNCQIVIFLLTSLVCKEVVSLASQITIAVLFNTGKAQNSHIALTLIKKSFEKIPSTLGIEAGVDFVYKDFNSTFCDLGAFLAFVNRLSPYNIVVLMLESCQCEMLLPYLNTLDIKVISICEPPLFLVSIRITFSYFVSSFNIDVMFYCCKLSWLRMNV